MQVNYTSMQVGIKAMDFYYRIVVHYDVEIVVDTNVVELIVVGNDVEVDPIVEIHQERVKEKIVEELAGLMHNLVVDFIEVDKDFIYLVVENYELLSQGIKKTNYLVD